MQRLRRRPSLTSVVPLVEIFDGNRVGPDPLGSVRGPWTREEPRLLVLLAEDRREPVVYVREDLVSLQFGREPVLVGLERPVGRAAKRQVIGEVDELSSSERGGGLLERHAEYGHAVVAEAAVGLFV